MARLNDIRRSTSGDLLSLAAILAVALILIPAGAHLFEMPNKLRLSPADYMIAQRAYDGWALFAVPIIGALIAVGAHAHFVRANRPALALSLIALGLILASQLIFWLWTYPMNSLTANWTVMPADLDAARWQWEVSHAVNALIIFLALIAIVQSALSGRDESHG